MTKDVFPPIQGIAVKVREKEGQRLLVPVKEGHLLIDLQKLCHCTKISRYWSEWILEDDTIFKIKYSLNTAAKFLEPNGFFMISASTIVKLERIFQVSNAEKAHLQLVNGKKFALSIRKRRELLETLKKVYS